MKKYRIKTNVYLILFNLLILLLPLIDTLHNKIIFLIYYLIQFIIANILYKRFIK